MKILLCCVVTGGIGYISYSFGAMYKRKVRFFEDVICYIASLKIEINYRQSYVYEFTQKYMEKSSKDFKKVLHSFLNSIGSLNQVDNEFLSIEEKGDLMSFLNYIGKSDVTSQNLHLEFYQKRFNELLAESKERYKKEGSMIAKLGFLFAGLVCLLVV